MTLSENPDALLDRLVDDVPALVEGRRSQSWFIEAVRWDFVSAAWAIEQGGRDLGDRTLEAVAPFLDGAGARALLASRPEGDFVVRPALLSRLLDLGERPFVVDYLAAQTLVVEAGLLAALPPAHPPREILGDAFDAKLQAMVIAAREHALGGWASLLYSAAALLHGSERAALVDWAVREPRVLQGVRDEVVMLLARAGRVREAVERACAVADAYPRAIALAHIGAILSPDHPDRELLAGAQLELLKLPPSSQPHRRRWMQIFDAPVPASMAAEVVAVVRCWPDAECAVGLLLMATHTPSMREAAWAALTALTPEDAALGALAHFDALPVEARETAFERGRAVAMAWEARGEQLSDLRAARLFYEHPALDAAGLWTAVARRAPDRAAAHEALARAERCRELGKRSAVLRLAIAAAETLPAGELRCEGMAKLAEATRFVLDLEQRMGHLGRIFEELPEPHRARHVAQIHEMISRRAPHDWLTWVLITLDDLAPADARALHAHAVEAVRAQPDVPSLLTLADSAEPPVREALLTMALSEAAARSPLVPPALFTALRPDDPWKLHERLATMFDGHAARAGVTWDRAGVASCLAASQPPSHRAAMLEKALSAWEHQGLIKLDIGEVPTESLWPVLDRASAQRVLALCLARPDDEGTEECLAGVIGVLARLGEDPAALVKHLPAIATGNLRAGALAALAPGLSPEEVTRQMLAIIEAADDDEHPRREIVSVVPLLRGVDASHRARVLEALERQLVAEPKAILDGGVEWLDVLLAIGEDARVERWLERAPACDDAVDAYLAFAVRLPQGDPRRADWVRRAENLGDALPPAEQSWIHADVLGREDLPSEAWAARRVNAALSEDRMCIRDLMPWMPLARRALGDTRMAALVSRLVAWADRS